MEKAVGLHDHKVICDSIADTCGENISDEEKTLEQSCLKLPIKCKVYSGDRTECESSSISLNSEDCESNVGMNNKEISLGLLETHTSASLPI
jgi:hypothetical protein